MKVGVPKEIKNREYRVGLTPASVLAIDTGADLTGMVDDDFEGLPRPIDGDLSSTSEWDIGPYEYRHSLFVDGFESGDVSSWSATLP